MRLKNVPFKKSLKDELRNKSGPKKAKDFKDLHLKNPKDTSVNETKEIILNLRRIWGEVPAENPKISKDEITKKSK
tara:strand:- start:377 stop:604 length:228 start_codon:yes stop_codon:yes gene_type:complete